MKNFSDEVKCYVCGRTGKRFSTIVLETPKGRFRLCRDCYSAYAESKLHDNEQELKHNIKLYNMYDINKGELMAKQEKFIKDYKDGRYG